MPYYCTVPRCTSMAGKAKNVSFHQFPRDEELAKLWNKILKRGKPYTKYSKVCSLHFKPEDYTITSVGKNKGQWRTLRKDAIPSQNLPSESPTPYHRKQWSSWGPQTTPNVIDPTIQQHVAQAIYMQTMLAMQAAGGQDMAPILQNNGPSSLQDQAVPHSSNDSYKETKSNSYKCTECSKCFKDPDVFLLHKRSHIKNEQKQEKENFNTNTLRTNPILANLLKTNTENIFDNNIVMENLLMTALAANLDYIRNISMIKNERTDCTEEDTPNDGITPDTDGVTPDSTDGITHSSENTLESSHSNNETGDITPPIDTNERTGANTIKDSQDASTNQYRIDLKYADFKVNGGHSLDSGDNTTSDGNTLDDRNDSELNACDKNDLNESFDSNNLIIDDNL